MNEPMETAFLVLFGSASLLLIAAIIMALLVHRKTKNKVLCQGTLIGTIIDNKCVRKRPESYFEYPVGGELHDKRFRYYDPKLRPGGKIVIYCNRDNPDDAEIARNRFLPVAIVSAVSALLFFSSAIISIVIR